MSIPTNRLHQIRRSRTAVSVWLLSSLMELLQTHFPSCWSTNFSSKCNNRNILPPYTIQHTSPHICLACTTQLIYLHIFPLSSLLSVIIILPVCFSPCSLSKCSYTTFFSPRLSSTIASRITFAFVFSPICPASRHLSGLSSHRVKQAEQIDYKQWAGGNRRGETI